MKTHFQHKFLSVRQQMTPIHMILGDLLLHMRSLLLLKKCLLVIDGHLYRVVSIRAIRNIDFDINSNLCLNRNGLELFEYKHLNKGISIHVKMHPNFHLSYSILVCQSKNVMITLQKNFPPFFFFGGKKRFLFGVLKQKKIKTPPPPPQ
jgi:hypothetical protein